MRGGGCIKIPNRTNGVDIPHTSRPNIRDRSSIASPKEVKLKKIKKVLKKGEIRSSRRDKAMIRGCRV